MPRYFYVAKSFEGTQKTGFLEARNEYELAKMLHQQGYVLVSANLEKGKKKKGIEISIPFLNQVSLSEKMMFTRNLQVMISAGINLPRALRILATQTKSKKFKKALINIAEEITKGKSFSSTLVKYPDIFSEFFQSMIKIGEEAGTLEEVLRTLTQQMERNYELRSKIKGAMIYPAVIISAMLGIGFLMLVMVVPRLAETFKDLNIELPPITQFVIGVGTFLSQKWPAAILAVVGIILVLRLILKTKGGKRALDYISLKIPIISPIVKKTNSAYAIRTLSSLFTSGVPIVRSLEVVAGALENSYFKEVMTSAAEIVKKGGKFSEALKGHEDIYPETVIQMIEVGEETGETSSILKKLADFYEEEVTNTTKNLVSVIEPILILIIGAAIGFFAVSMFQPIYSMLGSIK